MFKQYYILVKFQLVCATKIKTMFISFSWIIYYFIDFDYILPFSDEVHSAIAIFSSLIILSLFVDY
jgi:hypothetical protein